MLPRHPLIHTCLVSLVFFAPSLLPAANWPSWRGAAGTGVSSEQNLPVRWSPTENVHWKTA
jgi:hypothetical protein